MYNQRYNSATYAVYGARNECFLGKSFSRKPLEISVKLAGVFNFGRLVTVVTPVRMR